MQREQLTTVLNAMRVNVIFCKKRSKRRFKAVQASTRLIQTARMLGGGNRMVLLLEGKDSGKCLINVYSDERSGITSDDYGWIFENCARTEPSEICFDDTVETPNEKKYILKEMDESSCIESMRAKADHTGDDPDSPCCLEPGEYYFSAFSELFKRGARMKVSIDAEDEKKNSVIIIVPDDIPLRIKAMLSLADPHSELIELSEERASEHDTTLSYRYMRGFIENILMLVERLKYVTAVQYPVGKLCNEFFGVVGIAHKSI